MKRALSPLVVLLGMAGCDGGKAAVPPASPILQTAQAAPAPEGAAGNEDGAKTDDDGAKTDDDATPLSIVTGRVLLVGDGTRPMVDERLVPARAFEERFGATWRAVLRDRRVRVTGAEHSRPCNSGEECLSGGEVRRLLNVRTIEVCWSPDRSFTMDRKTVPCPPTKAEERACVSACSEESRTCSLDARDGKGPGLRRCGCAMVTCEESCEKSGEPDFHCH